MTTDKVQFDKRQYEAFIWLEQTSNFTTEYMVDVFTNPDEIKELPLPLQSVSQHDLLKAVFNGYEIKTSPGEQLHQLIMQQLSELAHGHIMHEDDLAYRRGQVKGLQKAAEIFDVPYRP